mmetsp:Transcript_7277/g.17462  ORF Transcript_7277/g.17462 Transcript_7277/m.17462 type:complete len:84 (-) Transcript_7277:493-744(-)
MPTSDDEWEVEKVLQYRTYYRQEQWLIKWKDYGEDRNTWEPLAHLSDDVQVDAQRVKELCIAEEARKAARVSQGASGLRHARA